MLDDDSAKLKVLFLGGSGTISTSSVRLALASGMDVYALNRGTNAKQRDLPEGGQPSPPTSPIRRCSRRHWAITDSMPT